jgi:hypothetical protein
VLLSTLRRFRTAISSIVLRDGRDYCPVYVFRSALMIGSDNTVIAVAPLEQVVSVYGGGGVRGEGGLVAAFGGAIEFRNDGTGERYIGVWGKRNASRFRTELRKKFQLTILREPPPARLVSRQTAGERPKGPDKAQTGT